MIFFAFMGGAQKTKGMTHKNLKLFLSASLELHQTKVIWSQIFFVVQGQLWRWPKNWGGAGLV
jgi:hypothetical protein